MSQITRTEAAPFNPTIVAQTALGYLISNLVVLKTAQNYTKFSPNQFVNFGETLQLPKIGSVTVNDKSENSPLQPQNPTATALSLTINKHKEATVSIERRAATIANQDVLALYVQEAMQKMAEQAENDAIAAMVAASGTVAIGTGVAITEANIIAAKQALTLAKAPDGMKRYGVVNTSAVGTILQVDRLVTWLANGQKNNIASGSVGAGNGGDTTYSKYVGPIYNFEMWESQNIPVVSSQAKNLFYAEDALIMASKPLAPVNMGEGVISGYANDEDTGLSVSVTRWFDGLNSRFVYSIECLYGFLVSRPEHVVVCSNL